MEKTQTLNFNAVSWSGPRGRLLTSFEIMSGDLKSCKAIGFLRYVLRLLLTLVGKLTWLATGTCMADWAESLPSFHRSALEEFSEIF